MNQVSEVLTVRELAEMISKRATVPIEYLENPRKELAENDLQVANTQFLSLGFEPTLLSSALMDDIYQIAKYTKNRFIIDKVNNSPKW